MAESLKKSGWHQQKNVKQLVQSERPRAQVLAERAREFDARFPVGAAVWFWKTLPGGPKLATFIRQPFFVGDNGWVCCFVEGVRGAVGSDFISAREVKTPLPAAAAETLPPGGYVVGIFPRGTSVTRAGFEAAADRPVILAGGGPDESLFGVRVRPGEDAKELRQALRKRFPSGRFSVEPDILPEGGR